MKTFSEKSSSKDTLTRNRQGTNHKQVPVKKSVPAFPGSIPLIQRKSLCPCDGGCPMCTGVIQPKLTIDQPNDKYEQEADRVADQVMRMPEPKGSLVNGHSSLVQRESTCPECIEEEEGIQTKPIADQITPIVQRQAESDIKEEEEEPVQLKSSTDKSPSVTAGLQSQIQSLRGKGQSLPESTRAFFESRFGQDFSHVRVHMDTKAADAAKFINAQAFTTGKDVVFGAGQYTPHTNEGKRLLAHELSHVLQQGCGRHSQAQSPALVQRKTALKRDLQSPRFKGDPLLEDILDGKDEMSTTKNSKGPAVRKVQKALIDAGYPLKKYGADGKFGDETKNSFEIFQYSAGLDSGINQGKGLADGVVRAETMLRLDQLFPAGATPAGTTPPEPTDFQVLKRPELAESTIKIGRFFFDFDSYSLPMDEKSKVIVVDKAPLESFPICIAKDQPLELIGYASEEGAAWYNHQLTLKRIAAVDKVFKDKGHKAKRTPVPKPAASYGEKDYRYWRAVEVALPGSQTGTGKEESGIVSCPKQPNIVTKGLVKANEMLVKAINALKNPNSPETKEALELFDGTPAADKLIPKLKEVQNHLKENVIKDGTTTGKGHQCADETHDNCDDDTMAYNSGTGQSALIVLCPNFLLEKSDTVRADYLIHEGSHGTKDVETSDFARRLHRLIWELPQDAALKNADSYSLFVRLIDTPGSVKIGPKYKDIFMGFSEKEKEEVQRVIGFVEVWVDLAADQTGFLYEQIKDTRRERKWSLPIYQFKMNLIAPRFGLTRPPKVPRKRDQWAMAAIHDRYKKMGEAVTIEFRSDKLKIIRITTSDDLWTHGSMKPGNVLKLGTGFFSLTNYYKQVLFLLLKLVEATPDISTALEPKYVEFTDLNRQQHGHPDP